MYRSFLRDVSAVKVGDKIAVRDALKGRYDMMTICQIRRGSRIVFDYADKDGNLVNYFAVQPDDVIEIWEDRD